MDVEIKISKNSGVALEINLGFTLSVIITSYTITMGKRNNMDFSVNHISCTKSELSDPDFLALKNMTGETTLTLKELDILYNMYLYLTDEITEQELCDKVIEILEG